VGEANQNPLSQEVGVKAERKIKARSNPSPGVWFGLGMVGLIGWSIAIPTLLGAGLGLWLDNRNPGTHSWTLGCLLIGLAIGCLNAWRWVAREEQEMRDENE